MSIMCVLGLDFETTGTDPVLDGILEVGAKVITPDFKTVAIYQGFIMPTTEQLGRMSPEVRAQHERSGLLDAVAAHGESLAVVQDALGSMVEQFWPKGGCILLGTTIQFDRGFIKAQLPLVEKLLHYRMLDARSLTLAEEIFAAPHRAFEDIDYSIETVKRFVGRLK